MKPENYPDIIYKYRSWSNEFHKNILTKGELYLSAPKNFNDPFDFGISKNFLMLDSPEKIARYVDEGIEKHKSYLLKKGRNLEHEKAFHLKRLQNLEQYQEEYETIEFDTNNNHYGILSLSARWDSILMWSHYGDFHKGFNVGYNEDMMRESGLFGKGGPVIYSDTYPQIDAFSEHTKEISAIQTHYKSKEWEYEQEYRLTNLFYTKPASETDRIINIPFEFIEEINLGVNISDDDKKEIVEIANQKNIKIFQTKKIPFKFELNKFQI